MKIEETNEVGFIPIKITLNTKSEAKVMATLTGNVEGGGPIREMTDKIYAFLSARKIETFSVERPLKLRSYNRGDKH